MVAEQNRLGLPPKPFLYTLDQIAYLLSVEEEYLKRNLIHYEGRTVGARSRDRMVARDISPSDAKKAEWRVAEMELIGFMRRKGFRYYERGYVRG